jgi:hypothetical protein
MEAWNRVVPGLVPHVEARVEQDGRESFVGRYLDGRLLRDVYLTGSWDEKLHATRRLMETLREMWLATLVKETPRIDYVRQIRDRLPDLYALHPDLVSLRGRGVRVFGIVHRSIEDLLESMSTVEAGLAPPISVRLHGDFNTNNVVFDAATDRIHFIDVHRSGSGDYLQDVGVFLVSNLRHPIQDAALRASLVRINRQFRGFAAEFGRLTGDVHFESRLLLSRARSFITSGRLVTDPDFARDIYLHGVRLLERVALAVQAA